VGLQVLASLVGLRVIVVVVFFVVVDFGIRRFSGIFFIFFELFLGRSRGGG
jgi:hypothetical protein